MNICHVKMGKVQVINLLQSVVKQVEDAPDEIFSITFIDEDNGVYKNKRGTLEESVNLVNEAKTIIFSNTPTLGNLDLYDRVYADERKIPFNHIRVNNIVFPLKE